ncbi:hypothetical protein [Methylobacterium oxalidis]|uniref:Uncharacterized protein n=1 Tax=Methylobacterium oxalidis TaxID=944322 RepID=A0A512J5Z3_9HYPH|nr:hypothetical protein [Methylobacterium oxalidis]GEP05343.1 hypothetical protein MOX02_33810 [Methylobacterium oxalidis]GJE31354.1 hypothetical protein LDDCCGHA_1531 [Methylobacterium oxalidis]GLS63518.1 hypothetical protein GCM10007888_18990 [Methylobacterium oxalidis]
MKRILVALGLLAGLIAILPTEASAVVCARGVYRAGCVGPNAAVGVRRGYHGSRGVVVRRGVYGPRTTVYRRGYRR